jgi:acetyl-CoA synthetase
LNYSTREAAYKAFFKVINSKIKRTRCFKMAEEAKIESMMGEGERIKPPKWFTDKAYIKSVEQYEQMYKQSIDDPDGFWGQMAENTTWYKKWDKVYQWNPETLECKWFEGGKLNAAYNCLDRHLSERGNKVAIIWESDDPKVYEKITFKQLHEKVCKFANVLKKHGVKKGDRVCIYLPMIPELAVAMLACARIGAIHSIVFGGFSAESLKQRILDSTAKMLITSNVSVRGGKKIPLKKNADAAVKDCDCVEAVIVVKRTDDECQMQERDILWDDEMKDAAPECECEQMDAEDPLFILYTSGTTGKPKGVLHTTGGYMVYTQLTFNYIFDYHEEDVYWCTADIGWVTGHSYIIYGPLGQGATTIMFEGTPFYPEPDRFWEVVEKHKVNIFYTAPTAIRAVAKYGDEWPKKRDLSSLQLLGSVGEPINPEAWLWYHRVIGRGECPVVDTWWQTETGGILITPLPGAFTLKPASASRPFFGVKPKILKKDANEEAAVNEGGFLVIEQPWPSMLRTVYGDPDRFRKTYFSQYPGIYLTGDGARIDEDGDYWLMGRIDDVINISGHRIGTAEVESALVLHEAVAEAAVVPVPHEIKGQALYAFVTLNQGVEKSEELAKELRAFVGKEIGPIAKPEAVQFADALPKTRSGKIMRRILRKIAAGTKDVGDVTTLADPTVVENLIKERGA